MYSFCNFLNLNSLVSLFQVTNPRSPQNSEFSGERLQRSFHSYPSFIENL